MSWFGGSDSKSTNDSVNKTSESNISVGDYGDVDGSKSTLLADLTDIDGSVTLSSLDGGAIEESYEFAGQNLAAMVALYDNAMTDIDASSQRETSTAMAALNKSTTLSSGELLSSDAVKLGGLIILAVVTFAMLKGKK